MAVGPPRRTASHERERQVRQPRSRDQAPPLWGANTQKLLLYDWAGQKERENFGVAPPRIPRPAGTNTVGTRFKKPLGFCQGALGFLGFDRFTMKPQKVFDRKRWIFSEESRTSGLGFLRRFLVTEPPL